MKYKKGNKYLEITQDEMPESPREWDNLGVMACFHRDYNLGDSDAGINKEDFSSWTEMEAHLRKIALIVIPLRLYDHSGISISAGNEYPFNCRWDSMQVGFIYATKEAIFKEYGRVLKRTIKKAREVLLYEVEVYNQYLTGDIYGFRIYKLKKCKECGSVEEIDLDSCWGFYGSDFKENGLYESAGIKDINKWKELD